MTTSKRPIDCQGWQTFVPRCVACEHIQTDVIVFISVIITLGFIILEDNSMNVFPVNRAMVVESWLKDKFHQYSLVYLNTEVLDWDVHGPANFRLTKRYHCRWRAPYVLQRKPVLHKQLGGYAAKCDVYDDTAGNAVCSF